MKANRIEDGEGLLLREPSPADAPGVLAVHGDPRVYVHDPHETHADLGDADRFLRPILRHWREHGFGYWTVLVPRAWWEAGTPGPGDGDGERVNGGMGGVQRYTLEDELVLNVYYRFAPAIQGRGLAGRVLRAAMTIAPEIAPGTDLVVRTRPANTAARRVAERAGFQDLGLEPGTTDMRLLRVSGRRPAPAPG
ncbi:RimJ/RimL family protein N-acetyltransferase [Herbihabitans rhizosphaerae]|uniref:RimJ/RimL family protein N-acetyltransferase n=1 Tax=Herbihabitans rhizosphaerae TaxID=1872711 RepID=A0A4Q7L5V4_9PSEU|nr:GNAT family N-acetyltransferase [Herbihabitans rhizosphaerae]RZS45038.1 RimJ/RimL family protein N-acetyltransferase [Herbihabitans rhizosphaerae]